MKRKPFQPSPFRTKQLAGAVMLLLMAASCQKQIGNQQQIQNPNAFDIDKFEANIKNTFGAKTVGFSYAIAVGDNIVRHGAMGMASMGSADGISGYTSETRQELFSVTKFMTAIAAMKLLQLKGKTLMNRSGIIYRHRGVCIPVTTTLVSVNSSPITAVFK